VPLEDYTRPELYVIQVDQFGRHRVIFPDGDDVGVRFQTLDEAQMAIWMACEAAQEAVIHSRMVEHQDGLDRIAKWRTVENE